MELCLSGCLASSRTTGFWYFAESPSARQRATKLSANPLPRARSANTARHSLNRQRQSLPRATWQALGKGFAESHVSTRQRLTAVAREALVDGSLPSATMAGARQRLFIFFKKNSLPRALMAGSRQRLFICLFGKNLCRVSYKLTLGKEYLFIYLFILNISLPSVLWLALGKARNHSHAVPSFVECQHRAKLRFFAVFQFFVVFSLNSQ